MDSQLRLLFELPELDDKNAKGKQGIRCYSRITGFFLYVFQFAVYSSEKKIYINKSSLKDWMKLHKDCRALKGQSFGIDKKGVNELINHCKRTLIDKLNKELDDFKLQLNKLESGKSTYEEDAKLLEIVKSKMQTLPESSSPEIQTIRDQIKSTLNDIVKKIAKITLGDISGYGLAINSALEIFKHPFTEKDILNIKEDAKTFESQKNQIISMVEQLKRMDTEIDRETTKSLEEMRESLEMNESKFNDALVDAEIVLKEQISNFYKPSINNLRGIPNITNSCYQNSCCQALFNSPYLVHQLFHNTLQEPKLSDFKYQQLESSRKESSFSFDKKEFEILAALREAIKNLYLNWSVSEGEVSLRECATQIRRILFDNNLLQGNSLEQQDGQECLLYFLRAIDYSINFQCEKTAQGERGLVFEEANMCNLAIEGEIPSLQQLVKDSFNTNIEGNWRGHLSYQETKKFTSSPKVLIFHLKRFDNEGSKIEMPVDIPDEFDLRPYLLNPPSGKVRYKLKSYISHHGSTMDYGHYTANLLKETNTSKSWVHASDDHVQKLDSTEAEERKLAYIYFYELC